MVLGGLLILSGLTQWGLSIYYAFNAEERHVADLTMAVPYRSPAMQLSSEHFAQVALLVKVDTTAVIKDSSDSSYQAQYRFPVQYRLLDEQGGTVFAEENELAWDQGARQYHEQNVGPLRGELLLESGFAKFKVPSTQNLYLEITISPDDIYGARAENITLKVYDQVHKHTSSVLTGIGLFFSGVLVFIIGLILLLSHLTKSKIGSSDSNIQESDASARNWAVGIHLSGLSGYVLPMGGLVVPLILWVVKRKDHPFIDQHGREAVNFRLSYLLYYCIAFILVFVLIGFFMILTLLVIELVLVVMAAVSASDGKEYRYPGIIRFIR